MGKDVAIAAVLGRAAHVSLTGMACAYSYIPLTSSGQALLRIYFSIVTGRTGVGLDAGSGCLVNHDAVLAETAPGRIVTEDAAFA